MFSVSVSCDFVKLLKMTSSIIYVFAAVLGRRVPRKHPHVADITLNFSSDYPPRLSIAAWKAECSWSTMPHMWHSSLNHLSCGWLREANGFGSFINNKRHGIQIRDREGWEEQLVFCILESSCLGIPCSCWQLLTCLKRWSFERGRETKAFTNSILKEEGFLVCKQFNYTKDFCQVWTDLCFLAHNYQFIYSLENRRNFS